VQQNKIDFLALQETKLVDITPSFCYSLWGSVDCDWTFRPSEGSSGGILSIWRKSCASLISTFQGEGYVGVCLDWGVERMRCVVINVNSKCKLAAKRRLWESLVGLVCSW